MAGVILGGITGSVVYASYVGDARIKVLGEGYTDEDAVRRAGEVNKQLVELSRETDIPMVATVDSHYVNPDDAPDHDILLCIGTNVSVMDEKRMRMNAPVYYVQSEAEVRARFAELPEAVDNTQRVAEACDLELEFGRLHLPDARQQTIQGVEQVVAKDVRENKKDEQRGRDHRVFGWCRHFP